MSEKRNWLDIALRTSILAATFGLVVRIGIFKPYTLQPYEIGILIAGILSAIYFMRTRGTIAFIKEQKMWISIFLGCALFLGVGAIQGHRIYGTDINTGIALAKDFFLFATVCLGFLLVSHFGETTRFRKNIFLSMGGVLFFSLSLIFPSFVHINQYPFFDFSWHFLGFHDNPTLFAMLALLPFIAATDRALGEKAWHRKAIAVICAIFLFALILWSSSRSAWISVFVVTSFLVGMHGLRALREGKFLKKALLTGAIGCLAVTMSFFMLPHPAKIMVLDRIFPSITGGYPSIKAIQETSVRESLAIISEVKTPTLRAYQSRQTLWPQALELFSIHPILGIGPEYARISGGITEGDKGATIAHNTFLQVGLSGGILLLLLYLYFLWQIGRRLFLSRHDEEWRWLTAAYMGMGILLFIGDFFFHAPPIWIVLGLIAAKARNEAKARQAYEASISIGGATH